MRTIISALLATLLLSACGPMEGFYPDDGGYYDSGYHDPYDDDRYHYDRDRYEYERRRREEERLRRDRKELERERRKLEEERERHEEERRRREEERKKKNDACPPGFRPGSSKCTDKQRKRGCQDTRSPSGRLCVRGI